MDGPLDERDLHYDLGPHPMGADARQAGRFCEGAARNLESVEALAEVEEQLGVEARADLPRENEIVALEVAKQDRAEAPAHALRIGEAADDQLLRGLALHLEAG